MVSEVFAVIGNLINNAGCKTIIVNGVEDHVHCFFGLKPALSISDLMRIIKTKSSKYINEHNLTPSRFEWQRSYGVFSYHRRDFNLIYKYIKNQERHHKKESFQREYLYLLKEFEVEYDKEYLFHDLI